jgi:hypothetical protein
MAHPGGPSGLLQVYLVNVQFLFVQSTPDLLFGFERPSRALFFILEKSLLLAL